MVRTLTLKALLKRNESDEHVKVTPKVVRLRKRIFDEGARRRLERQQKTAAAAR